MSNFMKNVVEEALYRKKPSSQQKKEKHSYQPLPQKNNDMNVLDQLIRPNYQNKNLEKRLSLLHTTSKQEQTTEHSLSSKASEFMKQPKPSFDDSISQLKKVSYSNSNRKAETNSHTSSVGGEKSHLIGTTKDGSSIWFYPSVHPKLSSLFHRATSGYSVAIVNSNNCYPSQLLLLNEWLNIYPELKYHLIWDKASNQSFTLELYDSNSNRLETIAQEIFQQLSKRSLNNVETFQLISPSAWISKQLGIMKSVESIGIVEGLSYFKLLLLLDHFYKRGHSSSISIELEQHYLLLNGNSEAVKETLLSLNRMTEQI